MITSKRFSSTEVLYESERTIVHRAYDSERECSVILKHFRLGVHSVNEIKRFEHEYEIASRLDLHTVVQPYEIVETNSLFAIVYEDFDGISLKEYCKGKPLAIQDFLDVAIQIITAIADIHLYRIIHRDINPSNIIINREEKTLKITDFGIAAPLQMQHFQTSIKHTGVGTLAYMAPEQAGRMNRPVDFRSDYYSLGVTFYELLTGRLPFATEDPAEMLHCHIAKMPVPLYEVKADIPAVLSSIVLRLMEKMPEERYQSAEGIKHDLEKCRTMFEETGYIAEFAIGSKDFSHTFTVSNIIAGREREIEILKNSFDWVRNGHIETVVVTGASGVGKSTLIRELDRYTAQYGAYFVSGNCDRFHKNTPYYCIKNVLSDLIRQVLTESDQVIAEWKKRLTGTLADNTPLLAEFAPEFTSIIGEQKKLELSDVEREIHYRIMLQRLFSVITSAGNPLVIVIENIHWIDMAALNFIHLMMLSREHRHIMIVGSTRTKDMGESHPLMHVIRDINNSGKRIVQQIDLKELTLDEVNTVIAQSLLCDPLQTIELSEEVFSKTRGNPYFIRELLMSLYEDGAFQFDHENGRWNWNSVQVREKHFSKNIIDHMADKIKLLDKNYREPLIFASCIGISFSLEVLGEICRKPQSYLIDAMEYGMKEGLIIHDGEHYRFTHERVRHAASLFLSEDQKQVIHRQVGLFLLDRKQDDLDQNYFNIVNHMNYSVPLVTAVEERTFLAQLNCEAGKRAKEAAAYTNSYRYYQTGVKLLDESAWELYYDLMYALHKGAVQAALLSGESALIDTYVDRVMSNSDNVVHKADMIDMKIHSYISQNRLSDAVNNALMVLSILDIQIPKRAGSARRASHRFALSRKIPKRISHLAALPLMENELINTVSKILAGISASVSHIRPELYPLFVLKHLELIIQYGNSFYAPQLYAEYGMMLCQEGRYDEGVQFGKMALRMSAQERYSLVASRVKTIVYGFIVPWTSGADFQVVSMSEIYLQAIEQEDFEYAALAAFLLCSNEFIQGASLTGVLRKLDEFTAMISDINQLSVMPYMRILKQAILNLIERKGHEDILTGDALNEEEFLAEYKSGNMFYSLFYFFKGILAYSFGNFEAAYTYLEKIEEFASFRGFNLLYNHYKYCYALVLIKQLGKVQRNTNRRDHIRLIKDAITTYKKWAHRFDGIFSGRYHLLLAEYCRMQKKVSQAEHHFEKSLEIVAELDMTFDFATINETAGIFYLSGRKRSIARTLLQEAYETYQRWGAVRKADWLLQRYPDYIHIFDFVNRDVRHRTTHITSSTNSSDLDFSAVITALRLLSGEINYTRLIKKLMKIIMEHSGAVRGCLLLLNDGALMMEAESTFDEEIDTRVASYLIDEETIHYLPLNIINYVARIQETVALDDATKDGMFSGDEYFSEKNKHSLLCIPIMHHELLTGLLYLENNLVTGIFSEDRIKLLELICSQAAISIQNSRLYNRLEGYSKKLEEKVLQRTRELEKVNENLMDINKLLREARIEAERDMEMAANVQLSFIPKTYTDTASWDLSYMFRPMTGVSGDFYDFYEKDGVLLGAGLFDVSGHGISSGLITVIARSIIHRRFVSMYDEPLNKVLEQINDDLIEEIGDSNNYLTGILVRFKEDSVEYVNAAHPSILKYNAEIQRVYEINKDDESWRGCFLGIAMMRDSFGMMEVPMNSGDALVLFSDCLNEAANESKEAFGYKGIIEALEEKEPDSSQLILDQISSSFFKHVGKGALDDDLTVLVIRKK